MSQIRKDEPSIPLFTVGKKDGKSEEPCHETKLAQKKHSQAAATGNSYGSVSGNGDEGALLALLAGLLAELEKLFNEIGQKSGQQELNANQAQTTAVSAYGDAAVSAAKEERNTAMCGAVAGMIGAGVGLAAGAIGFRFGMKGLNGGQSKEEVGLNLENQRLQDHLDAFDSQPQAPGSVTLTSRPPAGAPKTTEQIKAEIEADLRNPTFEGKCSKERQEYLYKLGGDDKKVLRERFETKQRQVEAKLQKISQKYNLYSQTLNTAGQVSGSMGSSIGTAAGAGSIVAKGEDQAAAAQTQQAIEGLNKTEEKSGGGRNAADQEAQKIAELEDQLSRANTVRG